MTKKEKQREDILRHGLQLIRIFNLHGEIGPVELCRKLHRLEGEAHRLAERQCNEDVPTEEIEKKAESILRRVNALVNFRGQGIPVFINGGPRGYALKIADDYVRKENLDIHRDWGGYGIIAPDF